MRKAQRREWGSDREREEKERSLGVLIEFFLKSLSFLFGVSRKIVLGAQRSILVWDFLFV
jgi:hypothetical protein